MSEEVQPAQERELVTPSHGASGTRPYRLGQPAVSLDKALRVAGALEDVELAAATRESEVGP